MFSQELAKNILLKSGEFIPKAKINLSFINAELVNGSYYRFMQFSKIPSEAKKNILVENGIQFLEYIPSNTYVVSVSSNFTEVDKLKEFNVVLLQKILPTQKIDPILQNRKCPEWALNNNKASIKVLFYKNVNMDFISHDISKNKYSIIGNYFIVIIKYHSIESEFTFTSMM